MEGVGVVVGIGNGMCTKLLPRLQATPVANHARAGSNYFCGPSVLFVIPVACFLEVQQIHESTGHV